ncbi:MAG: NUDIX hydrolase [Candidatus Saccharimonadales bacterium]
MAYLHKVTCKVALFNPAYTKVLLVEYGENDFGIPGGHLEEGEKPDNAVRRELKEELGIRQQLQLERKDFWVHPDGKVILGYVGMVDEDIGIHTGDRHEIRAPHWVSISDIASGKITAGTYDDFILRNGASQ